MSKHTPGPWYAEQPAAGFSSLRQKETGRLVFALAHPAAKHGDSDISDEEKYANLALLEAAPDLLDALEVVSADNWVDLTLTQQAAWLIKSQIAIAKALGTAHVDAASHSSALEATAEKP